MKSKVVLGEEALKHATTIRDLSMELVERREAMEKELQAKANEILEDYKKREAQVAAEVEVEWIMLCTEMGISKEERETWYLNAAFLPEHGLAFVVWDEEKAQRLATVQARLVDERHKH